MCLENLVSDSFLFNVAFRHYILANKSSLLSRNRPGKHSLITHPPRSVICITIDIFNFKKQTNKQKKIKEKNTKNQKKLKKKNYKVPIYEKDILDKLIAN